MPNDKPVCTCGANHVIEEPIGNRLWSAISCASCSKHLGWFTNPAITYESRKKGIDAALASGKCTSWETMFLKNIREKQYLTAKQVEKYEQIIIRHGIRIPALDGALDGAGTG